MADMLKSLVLLFLLGLSFAKPSCPDYPYKDHVFFDEYSPPSEPPDTLLSHCERNADSNCIFTGFLSTMDEKKSFIAENVSGNSFEGIANWNRELDFGEYLPNGSTKGSSYTIKDAWLSILSVNPSVYEGEKLLVNTTGEVITRQGFTFVIQDKDRKSDCKTRYEVCGYKYNLTTSVDGITINEDNNQEAHFNLSRYSEHFIGSKLYIETRYLVHHYHWVTRCKNGECKKKCKYASTEDVRDTMTLSDSKNVHYLNESNDVSYIVDKVTGGTVNLWLRTQGNSTNIGVDIGNATFRKTNYLYKIRYNSEPYNILTKEKVPINRTNRYMFSVLENRINGSNQTLHLIAPYSDDCTLKIDSHFNSWIFTDICQINKSQAQIDLDVEEGDGRIQITARLYNNDTDTPLGNKELIISHGGMQFITTTDMRGEVEVTTERINNLVSAEFKSDFETRSVVHTVILTPIVPSVFESASDLSGLGIVAYLAYAYVRKVVPYV